MNNVYDTIIRSISPLRRDVGRKIDELVNLNFEQYGFVDQIRVEIAPFIQSDEDLWYSYFTQS